MVQRVNSKTKQPRSWFRFSLFLFLVIFNVGLIFEGTALALPQQDPDTTGDGGGGGGGSKNTQFYNYGTTTRQVYCQISHIGTDGVWVEYSVKTVYYLKEVCDFGGTSHQCSLYSMRLTWQSGGC